MYQLKILMALDTPAKLFKFYVFDSFPNMNAIIEVMKDAKVAHEFTVHDLSILRGTRKTSTNDGTYEIIIEPFKIRNAVDGTPKDPVSKRDREIGVYNG